MNHSEIIELIIQNTYTSEYLIRVFFLNLIHSLCENDRDKEWKIQFCMAQCLDEVNLRSLQKELDKAFALLRKTDENSSFNENTGRSNDGT